MVESKTMVAIPPGWTIKEQLEDRMLTQKEFALRMELSEKHISKLINGEVELTTDVSYRLEMVLGIPASFWNNLEARYRETLKTIEIENNMNNDLELASKFPYKEMSNLGWIPMAKTKEEKVINLRKFFEVNSLSLIENERINIFCRRLSENEKSDYVLLALAQKAKLEARKVDTNPININGLKKRINEFREMTRKKAIDFCKDLKEVLAKNGVVLVFLPQIGGSFLHGITFYEGKKIVLGLTVRGRDADKFWFSFFHEIAHIILGHLNQDYYEKMEDEANDFAKEALIPTREFDSFVKIGRIDDESIIKFSNKIGIDSGIVVGRLQKEGIIPYSKYNELKKKYVLNV